MRVIGGEFRSRRLKSLKGLETRPTPDRLRETLFNVIASEVSDSVFVDAYAGTGAVGIEALSRGAARAIFVESSQAACDLIGENLAELGAAGRARVVRGRVLQNVGKIEGDIVFFDPPYPLENEYAALLERLGEPGSASLVIAQHSSRFVLAEEFGRLKRTRVIRQGDNSLSFFRPEP